MALAADDALATVRRVCASLAGVIEEAYRLRRTEAIRAGARRLIARPALNAAA